MTAIDLVRRVDDGALVPFKCRACGSREVTRFAVESQAELDAVQRALAGPP